MQKKIIITFSFYGIGGAQRRAFTLANFFVRKGYMVYIVAVLGDDKTINEKNYYNADPNIKLIIIPEYYKQHKYDALTAKSDKQIKAYINHLKKIQYFLQPFKKSSRKINHKIKSFRKTNDLRAFLIAHQGATIINFGFNIFDKVYYSAKGLGFKIIYAETNASNKYSTDKYCDLTKKTIKKSDSLVFQTCEEAKDHGLFERDKTHIIHNPLKQNLPLPYTGQRKKSIVNFCRLSRQKNLLLLIQAFELLNKEIPGYSLDIYAETTNANNSEYKKELDDYIKTNNLENCVHILPPSSDIHNIILNSSMFVSSSDYEGISNSMIEAMAIGLPCVCTDCGGGGAREMITDGENGLLVPIGNAEALKKAMVRMITEEGLAEKCGRNAAEIRETHSAEKISEKWIEVIKNVNGD